MDSEYTKLMGALSDPSANQKVSVPKVLEVLRDQLTDVSKTNRSLHLSRLSMRLHFDLYELFNESKAEAQRLTDKIVARKPLRLVRVITPNEDDMTASYRLSHLQREADFIEKETGNYDVYIGYPFVEGEFGDGTHYKCPLVLFPVLIKKDYKKLEFTAIPDEEREPILNKTFIIAYQKFNRVKFDPNYDFEIDEGKDGYLFSSIAKCEELGMKFENKDALEEAVMQYEPKSNRIKSTNIKIRKHAILGLFPQTSSTLLADYEELIKNPPKEGALFDFFNGEASDKAEWLRPEDHGKKAFFVTDVDGSQERALLSLEKLGGIAVHGPPGTGKSQLIVNIIADSVAKGKKVLLVCEKRAALDVVYHRLAAIGLGDMVALVHDYNKDRSHIFMKASKDIDDFNSMEELPEVSVDDKGTRSEEILLQILEYHLGVNKRLKCGSTLRQLYLLDKDALLRTEELDALEEKFSFQEFSDAMERISDILPLLRKDGNGAFKSLQNGALSSLSEEKMRQAEIHLRELLRLIESLSEIFNSNEWHALSLKSQGYSYPKSLELEHQIRKHPDNSKSFLKFANGEWRKTNRFLESVRIANKESKLPAEYLIRELAGENIRFTSKSLKSIEKMSEYNKLMGIIEKEAKELAGILDHDVSSELVSFASEGSEDAAHLLIQLQDSLRNKQKGAVYQRMVDDLNDNERKLLSIAAQTLSREKNVPQTIAIIRHSFYSKWIGDAESALPVLKKLDGATYGRYRAEVRSLLEKRKLKSRQETKRRWHEFLSSQRYSNLKEIKFQSEKTKHPWSLRKMLREFSEKGMMDVFPVWLCSPETVSAIFPLEKGMFDAVIFDEASQCTLEHAIPALYRSKSVCVAGDEKQLPPFDLFSSHLDAQDSEEEDDSLSTSELKEISGIKSFLQLAKRRYPELLLNWHYRSKREELIAFSNFAFYSGKIQTTTTPDLHRKSPAIDYVKVHGLWEKRKNRLEAEKVVELIATTIVKPHPPSIGVVTFNSAQRDLIENLLEKKALSDYKFYQHYKRELERVENEELQSLFVKNIENVQGDERDMIIFSIGYAPSIEDGKVLTQFGTLSMEGGEHRLNVAVSRAREKIVVVSSIDPLQLRITEESNIGGKYLRKYLEYAKAVSENNTGEINGILKSLGGGPAYEKAPSMQAAQISEIANELFEQLSKIGLTVRREVGYSNYALDLAILDKEDPHRYALGIEIDKFNYSGLLDAKERDVYRQNLLESRGWKVFRVGSRDWWSDSEGIIRQIRQELKN
ncbi:MAG: AAA domain-containing protein [Candidatus Micrarchaeota archaeon]